MSDKELKELNISRELFNEWQALMNALWVDSQKKRLDPVNGNDNNILIGKFEIVANLVNSDKIEGIVNYDGVEILKILNAKTPEITSIIILEFIRLWKTKLS